MKVRGIWSAGEERSENLENTQNVEAKRLKLIDLNDKRIENTTV